MKRVGLIFLAVVLFISSAFVIVSETTWTNDKPHSQLAFTVTHLGFNDIAGTFDDFTTTVKASKPDFSDATFNMAAKIGSINTRVEARNNHLKSADFFDAEKCPELTFTSTGLKSVGKNKFKLTGNLTLHGVTKVVTVDLLYRGQTTNPMTQKLTSAFQITGTIKRSDFGIGEKFPEAVISNEVRISANGEFVQADKQ
ncbi:YceI family protein [Chitinophaga sancti]|uniref:Polyisoprenoid-binding protein YceI n=1 Tax=Chitinophaga sancti TaxID=1004 RepID=A0A1K1SKQ9_9BACT|nr:YceI family protein [Chitinophaga sancti]WQD65473.1 YceI family protein [Chitinophaga sancti]WQG88904.1 YceI family protein [Chitinophaga sancti]SFW84878.1 Polyisoprenoid-binding protein YceI [Chitinophaga sancti]